VRLRGHGTGIGIAAIDVTDRESAARVARDLVAFDGRGCLSPRVVLVAGAARDFAWLLHEALLGSAIPRGVLDEEARAASSHHRAVMQTIGELFEGPHHAVAYDPSPGVLALPPPHRATLVVGASALASIAPALVAAVGGDGPLADHVAARFPQARRSALGCMQKPPLDGPVDRRVSAWAARGS
jgi:hypothetical protein